MKIIKIAVRNLVEFALRSGNIDSGFMGSSRAAEGIALHKKIQNKYPSNAQAEVSLNYTFEQKDFQLFVEGRADGIFEEPTGWMIDEIKSTAAVLDTITYNSYPLHFAQAEFYGFIWCKQKELSTIDIQLTYIQLDTEIIKQIRRQYTLEELTNRVEMAIAYYMPFAQFEYDWEIKRKLGLQATVFPFPVYRSGQREMAVAVYKTIKQQKTCFAMAPTGVGKTVSTLFPALKAMGESLTPKIFYLTAKTITRTVAEETLLKLRLANNELRIKNITLTAKDKICFKDQTICQPGYCEYARGHFDRINEALIQLLLKEDAITKETIETYGMKYQVCPFELALDVTLFADVIIGDYNYLFDPTASLKRFFSEQQTEFTFLIDEAHNLVERGREMYSCTFTKEAVMTLKRLVKGVLPQVEKALQALNQMFLEIKKSSESAQFTLDEPPRQLAGCLQKYCKEVEEFLVKSEKNQLYEAVLDFYFQCLFGMKVLDFYDSHFISYVEKQPDITLKLFCIDPSERLQNAMKMGRAAILFSATLLPLPYYRDILGGSADSYMIELESPFDPYKRFLGTGKDVVTKFTERERSFELIAAYIHRTVTLKKGNYMVFFPSYKYLVQVYQVYLEKFGDEGIFMQESGMTEQLKSEFLLRFETTHALQIGFCVLGGSFSEGIDLTEDQLIGSIIVSPGLPLVCYERELIQQFFNKTKQSGFEYAYLYPGMNKVLQAAGRVIRTEGDKGVVMLLDQRFTQIQYKRLFPKDWMNMQSLDLENVTDKVGKFWQ